MPYRIDRDRIRGGAAAVDAMCSLLEEVVNTGAFVDMDGRVVSQAFEAILAPIPDFVKDWLDQPLDTPDGA